MVSVRRRGAVVAATLLVLAVLVGVAVAVGSLSRDDPGRPARVDVSAELKKFRAREAQRYALLVLHNQGRLPVTVERFRLVSPDLRELPPGASGTVLRPGERLEVPVRFGDVVCRNPLDLDATMRGAGRDGAVEARVRVAGGPSRRVRLRLPEPDSYLRTIVSLGCQSAAVASAVDLRFGDRWTRAGDDSLRGELVMRRREATGHVAVDSVDGSVVFRVEPSAGRDGPLLDLPPGTDEVRRPVTLALPWCSAHLLIEAKKAYVFPTRTRIDGRYVYTTLTPQPTLRDRLGELISGCVRRQGGP